MSGSLEEMKHIFDDLPDDLKDECECGDYRRQHNAQGICQICSWSGPTRCTEFRLAHKKSSPRFEAKNGK